MKVKELEDCLTGKLKLRSKSCPRHDQYLLHADGDKISLPTIVCLSRSSKELANNVLGSVAKALGLNEHALKETVGCRVGRPCVLICISWRILEFAHRQRHEQGEVFLPGVLAMIESVEHLLADPDIAEKGRWSASEQKVLARLQPALVPLCNDSHFCTVARRLNERIGFS